MLFLRNTLIRENLPYCSPAPPGVVAGPMDEGDLARGVVGDACLGNDRVRLPDNSLVSAVAAYFRLWHFADMTMVFVDGAFRG
jgi:hypothetical protein